MSPWIQTAVLWEHAEGDIVEGIAVDQGAQVNLTMMIALVRGDWQGAMTLNVQAYDPTGEPIAAMEVEGDPPPIPYAVSKIVAPIELVPTQPGVYWFDVRIDSVTITRVPLRIDWRA